jgi:hypothetical protein
MTDKAIEIAEEIYTKAFSEYGGPNSGGSGEFDIKEAADLIRPYLAPEYKYAQVPCSEHISAEGFTEAKMRPRKPYGAIGISVGEAKK